ncbi:MAG: TolC family protein, partial [Ruminiclostridium sp.]
PLSLNSFIEAAEKVSSKIKLLDDKIVVQERRVKIANQNREEANKKFTIPEAELLNNKKEALLYPMQAQNQLDELKWERQNEVKALKVEATKLFYQYIFKQQELDSQSKVISKAQKEFDIAKKKVEVGDQNSLSLNQSENDLSLAKQKLETLKVEKTGIQMKINSLLQRDLAQAIEVKAEPLDISEYTNKNLDLIISKLKESGHSIVKLQNTYTETKTEYYTEAYAVGMPRNREQLEYTLLDLENNIKDEKASVELKIRSDYNNLLNLKEDIEISKLTYDLNTKLQSVSELKYNRGLISISDYLKAAGDQETALISYNKAQLDYATAVGDFKLYIEE